MCRGLVVVVVAACGHVDFDDAQGLGIVQTQSIYTSGETTTTLPLTPTRADDLLVVLTANVASATPTAAIFDDAGDAFVSANALFTGETSLGEVWYAPHAVAGATLLTVNDGPDADREVWFLEIRGAGVLDSELAVDDVPDDGSAQGPSITPSRVPAVIVTQIVISGEIQMVAPPFSALSVLHGDDAALLVDTAAGTYGPLWTCDETGTYGAATLAFTAP